MKFTVVLLFITMIFIFSSPVIGIAQKIKFGKVSKEALEMTSYEKAPDSEALILYENQHIDFIYSASKGTQYQLQKHLRIKILKKSGTSQADIPISLYKKENLSDFHAISYNLVEGVIKKDEITIKDIFREKSSQVYTQIKYAIPNVQKGTVIDIRYTIASGYLFSLVPWQFQYHIPVIKSEFIAEVPEYYVYKTTFQGYESETITHNEITWGTGSFLKRYGLDQFKTKIYNWAAEHVPAFEEEPFMAASSNYISKIKFELSGTNFSRFYPDGFNQTWEEIHTNLIKKNIEFGGRLNKKRPFISIIKELTSPLSTAEEKIKAIFNYVQHNFQWNKYFSSYPLNSTKDLLKGEKGVSADINFTLIQMIRAAGIECHPVLLSTRNNGFINPLIPKASQFNHLIAAAKINGDYVLLDATDPRVPVNMLPEYDLNEQGRLFTATDSKWISLKPAKKYKTVTQAKVNLTDEDILEGKIKMLIADYAAKDFREQSSHSENKEVRIFGLEHSEDVEGLEIISSSFKNVEDVYKNIISSYDVQISDKAFTNGDLTYLEPLLFFGIKANPFSSEKRKFPVDFIVPTDETFILQLTIPEGYAIEELPENVFFSLPDKGGKFLYEYKLVNDNLIQLTNKVSIKNTFFLPEHYPALREFYNLIVEKQGAQVVLRKTD